MFSILALSRSLSKIVLDFIFFEQSCLLCGGLSQHQICTDCYHALPRLANRPHCPRCLLYLPPREIRCSNCQASNFSFDRILCSYEYACPLKTIFLCLKYQGKIEYTGVLSQLFWSGIIPHLQRLPEVIIPVPIHATKHKLRGFNQVDELLREFSRQNPHILQLTAQRIKETSPQTGLTREERKANLSAAFAIYHNLDGRHVAVVDDVVTTGSTVDELARECKQRGARQVDVWCLMRTQSG